MTLTIVKNTGTIAIMCIDDMTVDEVFAQLMRIEVHSAGHYIEYITLEGDSTHYNFDELENQLLTLGYIKE